VNVLPLEILKNAISLLYKKKGKDVLTVKELELMITMDYRWFTPKDARSLIELAISSGLVKKQKDGLKIAFDWRNREVPMGFAPSNAIFETAAHRSCFTAIIDSIEQQVKKPRSDIVAEINNKQESLNLAIEIAGLLVGQSYNIDMSEFYELVEKELMSRFGHTNV
jgi:hypothetical protein